MQSSTINNEYMKQYWRCYRMWGNDVGGDEYIKQLSILQVLDKRENIFRSFRKLSKEELEKNKISVYKPIM